MDDFTAFIFYVLRAWKPTNLNGQFYLLLQNKNNNQMSFYLEINVNQTLDCPSAVTVYSSPNSIQIY